jgi:hypothetical protein
MSRRNLIILLAGLAIALGLVLIAPLASPDPDGLERVAEDRGFMETARDAPFELIPDYVFPGIANEGVATVVAGVIGVLAVAALTLGLGALLRWRAARRGAAGPGAPGSEAR